jgi:hypothetical protein
VTSSSGGTCQLSDVESRDLRESDFVPSRDRYREAGVTLMYDDLNPICPPRSSSVVGARYPPGAGSDRYGAVVPYYPPPQAIATYPPPPQYADRRYDSGDYNQQQHRPASEFYGEKFSHAQYGSGSSGGYYGGGSSASSGGYYGGGSSSSGGGYYGGGMTSPRQPPYHQGGGSYGQYGGGSGHYGQSMDPHGGGSAMSTTVDGERCLHSCVRNQDAGFYYCQIDREGNIIIVAMTTELKTMATKYETC